MSSSRDRNSSKLTRSLSLILYADRASDFPKELVSRYSKQPFEIILDTVGDQATHSGCGSYAVKGAHYWNVGANVLTPGAGGLTALIKFVFSAYLLPTFLGGVPVKFHNTGLDKNKMAKFHALASGESVWREKEELRKKEIGEKSIEDLDEFLPNCDAFFY